MKRRTVLWFALAFVAIAVLGIVAVNRFAAATIDAKSAAAPSSPPASSSVELVTARAGTFAERIAAQGRIGPPAGSSAKMSFAQAGMLARVDVRVGDRVRAGDALATLDRSTLAGGVAQAAGDARVADASFGGGSVPSAAARGADAKLRVALARLATLERGGLAASSDRIAAQSTARQATLKVETDRSTLARDRTLFAGGVLAAKDVEAAHAQLDADLADSRSADAKVAQAAAAFDASLASARADVASARNDVAVAQAQSGVLGGQASSADARLAIARIAYDNGVLRAPSDGTVLAILKHAGEAVDPATAVLEVGPPNPHVVTLSVPADTAARIAVGDVVTLDIARGASGRVLAIVPAVDPATQSATVVVSGVPARAISGDAVAATIDVAHVAGILVPATAIVQDPQSGKTVVFVRSARPKPGDAPYEMREVVVRDSDAATAVLASGVRSGERIAARGAYTLLAPAGG